MVAFPTPLTRLVRSVTGVIVLISIILYSCNLLESQHYSSDGSSEFDFKPSLIEGLFKIGASLLLWPFIEDSLLSLVVTVGGLLLFGPRVESKMGYMGMIKYQVVVAISTAVLYGIFLSLLNSHRVVYGAWQTVEAVLVAQCFLEGLDVLAWPLPQASVPDARPPRWRRALAKVKLRHLPMLFALVALALDIVGVAIFDGGWGRIRALQCIPCVLGALTGWAYLRFSWSDVDTISVFAFRELCALPSLPRPVDAYMNRLFGRSFFGAMREDGGDGGAAAIAPVLFTTQHRAGGQVLLPGSTPEEAERRRAIALAALSRRLQEQQQQQRQVTPPAYGDAAVALSNGGHVV